MRVCEWAVRRVQCFPGCVVSWLSSPLLGPVTASSSSRLFAAWGPRLVVLLWHEACSSSSHCFLSHQILSGVGQITRRACCLCVLVLLPSIRCPDFIPPISCHTRQCSVGTGATACDNTTTVTVQDAWGHLLWWCQFVFAPELCCVARM